MTKDVEWLTGPDGKQYQKGALYLFGCTLYGEDDIEWSCINTLYDITCDEGLQDAVQYRTDPKDGYFTHIKSIEGLPIGIIKEPEIVPEEGCWYLCLTNENFGSFEAVMRWDGEFFNLGNHSYGERTLKIIKKVDV